MLTANRFPVGRDGTGRMLSSGEARRKRRPLNRSWSSTPTDAVLPAGKRWELDRIPDRFSGVGAQRERSWERRCRCSWRRPRMKTNKARWADQEGRCGVRRVNHVEREHFSLSADREDTAQKDPRPGGGRILGASLCSGFIVRVQSECRS